MSSKSNEIVTDQPRKLLRLGLSGKLLLITTFFVLMAEILIAVPFIANYRLMWLSDKLAAARTAALVLYAAPNRMVPDDLKRKLLDSVGAKTVALKIDNMRLLLAFSDMPPEVDHQIDMRNVPMMNTIVDGFRTMFSRDNATLLVVGPAPMGGDFVEIIIDELPLREAMWTYSKTILLISLAISVISGTLVYLSLLWLFVRPMRRLTDHMVAFAADPENPARIVLPSGRDDEIGIAERELAVMETGFAQTLQQKNRLAALGLAVSKINHDLRNLLASAQLLSDRLARIADPGVRSLAPKLMAALDRAIAYCQQTLAYGRAQEPPADRRPVDVARLLEDVRETLGLEPGSPIGWVPSVERGLIVDADPDQLLRALLNLSRNSKQALESRAPNDPKRDQIRIIGRREGGVVVLQVADTGPGIPEKARAHLFEPFHASARRGGTGLGLAIAAELIQAQGGEIRLLDGTLGATFRITIPDRPVALDEKRAERARA
ncbi:MAG TPA: HAMP domain-containing sensor histidine kinase [Xanthobacteraceae bacterium]|nr:HAMP domain-containing sensor histidine kinase [Xanthobacteraceae bacterium]